MRNLFPGVVESENSRADNRVESEHCLSCEEIRTFSVQYTRLAPNIYDTEWTCLECGYEFEVGIQEG